MPNFYTMKMRGGTEVPDDRQKVTEFLVKTGCVGIGDPDYTAGAGTFQNDIQIGDVIVLRANGPLALLKVTSDTYEYKAEGKFPEFDDWMMYARNVEVLSWYDKFHEKNAEFCFDGRGYLQACTAIAEGQLSLVRKWYKKSSSKFSAMKIFFRGLFK